MNRKKLDRVLDHYKNFKPSYATPADLVIRDRHVLEINRYIDKEQNASELLDYLEGIGCPPIGDYVNLCFSYPDKDTSVCRKCWGLFLEINTEDLIC